MFFLSNKNELLSFFFHFKLYAFTNYYCQFPYFGLVDLIKNSLHKLNSITTYNNNFNQLFFSCFQTFWKQSYCQLIQILIVGVLICKSKLFKKIVAAKQILLMISVPGAFWNGRNTMKILETAQTFLSNIILENSAK